MGLHFDHNCGFGGALRALDLAVAKSACAEIEHGSLTAP
jgi:hypothetical protein